MNKVCSNIRPHFSFEIDQIIHIHKPYNEMMMKFEEIVGIIISIRLRSELFTLEEVVESLDMVLEK